MASQKIIPNLWFNRNAKEAAEFYVESFPQGLIKSIEYYPSEGLQDFQKDFAGKELTVEFELGGYSFVGINAGSEFEKNPSISCFVNFDPKSDEKAREHLDDLWNRLIDGGTALMDVGEYDFSKRYGWVQDRYGMSWQLILTNPDGEDRPFIAPSFLFTSDKTNKAEEAINYYLDVFKDSRMGSLYRYEEDMGPANKGSLMFADFAIGNQWFAAMDGGAEHDFTFNEGVSLSISCKDQDEIDYYWSKLSSSPEDEMCGWCKDKFGVSWQIVAENMYELLGKPGGFEKMMEMKKIVIADF